MMTRLRNVLALAIDREYGRPGDCQVAGSLYAMTSDTGTPEVTDGYLTAVDA
jgi:hypothetical protein